MRVIFGTEVVPTVMLGLVEIREVKDVLYVMA